MNTKKYLDDLLEDSVKVNHENIVEAVEVFVQHKNVNELKLVDLGCDAGELTLKINEKTGIKNLSGVDINESRLELAQRNGLDIIHGNLNKKLPIQDEQYDIVVSNQVIEHVCSVDNFMEELVRILKPEGICVI